jgi:hypothetical protein
MAFSFYKPRARLRQSPLRIIFGQAPRDAVFLPGHSSHDLRHKIKKKIIEEECVMRIFSKFSYIGLPAFFLLLFAAPAFAQFEVSSDHFDGPPPANTKNKTPSAKKAHTRTNSSNQAAAGKLSTAKTHRATSASGTNKKSQPGTNNSASSAAALKPKGNAGTRSGTSTSSAQAAPSLKAQAVPAHRE